MGRRRQQPPRNVQNKYRTGPNKRTFPVVQTETCSEELIERQLNAFPTCTVFLSEDTLSVEPVSVQQNIQVVQHLIKPEPN